MALIDGLHFSCIDEEFAEDNSVNDIRKYLKDNSSQSLVSITSTIKRESPFNLDITGSTSSQHELESTLIQIISHINYIKK